MDTSKDSENRMGFPSYRRSHLRSHTYDTLVRILSHPSASSTPLHSPTHHLQIPDNGSGRMEQEKQQQEPECSDFVGSNFKDLKDPIPQKKIQEVHKTIEGVEDKGTEFNANTKVLNDIELMMGIDEAEDSLRRQVEVMSMQVNGFNMEQTLMDELELVVKGTEDLACDNSLMRLSSGLYEKQSANNEDDLMDYKVEHVEFQLAGVNNAMDSSNSLIQKGDIEEGEIYGDFGMDDNSFGMSSADSFNLQQRNIDEVAEAMQLSFDLDVNIFEDEGLLDYDIFEDEHEMWNEEEKLKTLICANNATNSSNNPIEEGEIEEGEIIGDFGMDGNSFDMSSEVKQKVDVSSKKKCGPGSEKHKARKQPCCNFARGSCMRRDKCPFDHQLSKYSCTNFVSRGSCSRGDACMFSHQVPTEKDIPTFSNARD